MMRLPFRLHDRHGVLRVDYRPNEDLVESGFDLFNSSDFDPGLAVGYPTVQACVDEYEGTGYRTATAFVQWVETTRNFSDHSETVREIDAPSELLGAGVPYFSLGYPATLYDAPAHNMNGARWMRWEASTWFVAAPARWTDYEIRPVAGFAWGYVEDSRHGVQMSVLRVLRREEWAAEVPWLSRQAPAVTFAER